MILRQTAKYALRAMATLASLPAGESMPAGRLAEFTDIPIHYLSKIMRRLVVEGLVHSRRGHGGGFSLAKPARKISFASILAASDFEVIKDECAYGWGKCDPDDRCPLHSTYARLKECVEGWIHNTTLADMDRDGRVTDPE